VVSTASVERFSVCRYVLHIFNRLADPQCVLCRWCRFVFQATLFDLARVFEFNLIALIQH
jgi:hypothetical protein